MSCWVSDQGKSYDKTLQPPRHAAPPKQGRQEGRAIIRLDHVLTRSNDLKERHYLNTRVLYARTHNIHQSYQVLYTIAHFLLTLSCTLACTISGDREEYTSVWHLNLQNNDHFTKQLF